MPPEHGAFVQPSAGRYRKNTREGKGERRWEPVTAHALPLFSHPPPPLLSSFPSYRAPPLSSSFYYLPLSGDVGGRTTQSRLSYGSLLQNTHSCACCSGSLQYRRVV
ncbi:unnamed protein product [Ixodes pacificus]